MEYRKDTKTYQNFGQDVNPTIEDLMRDMRSYHIKRLEDKSNETLLQAAWVEIKGIFKN